MLWSGQLFLLGSLLLVNPTLLDFFKFSCHAQAAEETGLAGNFTLKGIVHYHHFHKDGRFLEDKYFWVYRIENTQGKLLEKVEGGENLWMTEEQYRRLKNVFASFDEVSRVISGKKFVYEDWTKFVDSY